MSKILLSLPETLVDKIDDYCAKHDYERSEFLRYCLRVALNNGVDGVEKPKTRKSGKNIKNIQKAPYTNPDTDKDLEESRKEAFNALRNRYGK